MKKVMCPLWARWSFCFFAILSQGLLPTPSLAQTGLRINLQPDLVLGEDTGASFGTVLHLAVSSDDRIFVGDWMNKEVSVFSSEGEWEETIGGPGEGPGEFQAIHQIVVGRGDSLYVFDGSTRRLSVFSPGDRYSFSYSFRVSSTHGVPGQLLLPSDPAQGFLFVYRQLREGTIGVYSVSNDGEAEPRPIFEGRHGESLERTRGTSMIRTAPLFRRRPLVGITADDMLYYGWSEDIDLTFYNLSGEWEGVYKASVTPIPVTKTDIEYELRDATENRRRAIEGSEHPKTKPAVETVIFDDRSWVWVDRFAGDPTVSAWLVDPRENGKNPANFSLPDRIKIKVVRGGYAYAVSVDELGVPSVTRFRVTSG